MKIWLISLLLILGGLQYELWLGTGGLMAIWHLEHALQVQEDENTELKDRNDALAAEVVDLKEGLAAIEERARSELGMIKDKENFYQLVQ